MNAAHLVKQLNERMRTNRGFPFQVIEPDQFDRQPAGASENMVVVWFDDPAGDSFGPAQGIQRNPRRLASQTISMYAKVYGKSPKSGAKQAEHRDHCHKSLELLLAALIVVASVEEFGLAIGRGRFLRPEELVTEAKPKPAEFAGAVYELKFSITGSINDVNYSGEGLPEGTPASVANTATVAAA